MQVGRYRGYANTYSGMAARGVMAGYRAYQGYKSVAPYVKGAVNIAKSISRSVSRNKAKASTASVSGNMIQSRRIKPKQRIVLGKKKTLKTAFKAIKALKKQSEVGIGTLTYRARSVSELKSTVNNTVHTAIGAVSDTFLEAVTAQCRFFDPAVPGTLVQADASAGSYQRDFNFFSIYSKLVVRNNYQAPCVCTVYICQPKIDTSISPVTAMTNGLTDEGAPSATSPLVYITDSDQFNDIWKINKSSRQLLNPGEQLNMSHATKAFSYDASNSDSTALAYRRPWGLVFVIRLEGVLGHDTTADEQGFLLAGIDYYLDRTVVLKYNAGIETDFIYVTDGSSTFTNNGVVSQKPVADNIGYSVA